MIGRIVWSGKKARYYIDGKEVSKRRFNQAFPARPLTGAPGGHAPANWPMTSVAMGVSPRQIAKARAAAAQAGVPTDFNADGDAIFTSAAHRKQYCEAMGFYDRNGGYGDPQRK